MVYEKDYQNSNPDLSVNSVIGFSKRTRGLTSAIYAELESKKRDLASKGREIFNSKIIFIRSWSQIINPICI